MTIPSQTTRPIGSVVTRSFDSFGNVLTKREQFNTATTSYTYDNFSLVTQVTNPRNHRTTINRDPANGNPLSIVNHLLHTTVMEYDSRGLVTRRVSPNGLETVYTYKEKRGQTRIKFRLKRKNGVRLELNSPRKARMRIKGDATL